MISSAIEFQSLTGKKPSLLLLSDLMKKSYPKLGVSQLSGPGYFIGLHEYACDPMILCTASLSASSYFILGT